MKNLLIQRIERWFADHDDGDFAANDRRLAYSVIGPVNAHSRILYTTKKDSVGVALGRSAVLHKFSMIGRYGLPSRQDLRWIKEMVGPGRLFFVGDADPPDLMIFRWLQILLGSRRIVHLGVNDRLLKSVAIEIQTSFTIRLSRSEREALAVLDEVFPDYPNVLSPDCTGLLKQNRKIEAEVSVSFGRPSNAIFDHVLHDY
jgi:hypothetical protein